MITKEKEISLRDQNQIFKNIGKLKLELQHPNVFNPTTLLNNQPLQTRLLDYIGDTFITELLVGITKYMVLCEQKDLQKYANEKALNILAQLKKFLDQSNLVKPKQKTIVSQTETFKFYKSLPLEEKIKCLIKEDDIKDIDLKISKLDKSVFQTTLSRIIRIINFNYLEAFYQ